MPKPATTNELVDLIRRSRLVDEARLNGCARSAGTLTPRGFLSQLIDEGLLSPFQAEHLAAGRWKGLIIGSFRIRDKLGSGGTGAVFLAEHITLGRKVAIKVLSTQMANDPVARERFVREAKAAAALTHPNILHIIDVDPDAEQPYLVMEYIDGVSLQAAVARHGTFDIGSAAFCGRQVALALQRAHEVGLVHRDIKPANLLVDRTGLVKVLDLGIVRMELAGDLTIGCGQKLVLGTADYLAPEQAVNSHAVDSRADLYSLGATLYFLLAGSPPFPDGTPQEKVLRKQVVDPPRIERFRPDVPKGLADVIHKLLARNPWDRYRTPIFAAEALSLYATPESKFPAAFFNPSRATDLDTLGMSTPHGLTPSNPTPPPEPRNVSPAGLPTMVLPDHGTQPEILMPPLVPEPGPITTPVDVRPVRRSEGHSALWLALGVGILAVLVAGLAGYLWFSHPHSDSSIGQTRSAVPVAATRSG